MLIDLLVERFSRCQNGMDTLRLNSWIWVIFVTHTLLYTHYYAPIFELKSRVEDTTSIHKMCNRFFSVGFWLADFLGLCVIAYLFRNIKRRVLDFLQDSPKLVNVSTHESWNYGVTIFCYHLQSHVGSRLTPWRVERPKKIKKSKKGYLSFLYIFLCVVS